MSHQPTSSPQPARKKLTVPDIRARKGGDKLVLLTAYTAPMAELLDAHCDMLMVGDSLGMVIYGMESTLPVTLEMMIAHGRAVVSRARQCSVVVDMPFGSYQASPAQAFESAARILKETGAAAVKMEGGKDCGTKGTSANGKSCCAGKSSATSTSGSNGKSCCAGKTTATTTSTTTSGKAVKTSSSSKD